MAYNCLDEFHETANQTSVAMSVRALLIWVAAFTLGCLLIEPLLAAGGESVVLRQTYSGNIDYIATGASFRNLPNDTGGAPWPDSCSFVSPMTTSLVVNIPASANVIDAFLYFAGSADVIAPYGSQGFLDLSTQTNLTLNGIAVSTSAGLNDRNYPSLTAITGSNVDFFGARRDVSNIVVGPGVYTFAGMNVHRITPNGNRVDNQTCSAAWSLVVIYEDPAITSIRVINLFDGFQDFQNSNFDLQPRNFVVKTGASGKMTHLTFEGDESLGGANEQFRITIPAGGTSTAKTNSFNPLNNQYNNTITGPDVFDTNTAYGLDIDTYDISADLAGNANEYTVTTNYNTAQDLVLLMAEVILVENKDLADIEIVNSAVGSFVENSPGQYRLQVTNNGDGTGNPATGNATGYIQVFDDLPTGISFDNLSDITAPGWDCSTSVVASNRIRCAFDLSTLTGGPSGLDSGESLPDITIDVDIATPTSPVTNRAWAIPCNTNSLFSTAAIVSDGSMSTCDEFDEKHTLPAQFDARAFFEDISPATNTYFSITSKNSDNNNVDAEVTAILAASESDLSTSTKTVADLNGGAVNPADILEYTVTLLETAGNLATGVSLLDTLPANTTYVFGSLSVTGSSYTVVSTGSVLELSDITVPASGNVVVKFRVTVNSGTAAQAIDNIANITNGNGTGASPAAPTLFVSLSGVLGNKSLYLNNLSGISGDLSRTPPSSDSSTSVLTNGSSATFTLSPDINNSLTINSTDIAISLWLRNEAGTGTKDIQIDLRDETGGLLGTASKVFTMATGADELVPFVISTAGFTLNDPATDILDLEVTNNSAAGQSLSVHSKLSSVSSSIVIDANTVINVDSIIFKDVTCTTPLAVNPNAGDTLCIEAVVSDPFGDYDIQVDNSPTLQITDPDASTINPNTTTAYNVEATLNPDSIDGDDTRVFEWLFPIPATSVGLGTWNVQVTADEGQEGIISHSLSNTFQTAISPNLSTSVKSVVNLDSPVNHPGDTLRYTVSLIESAGGNATGVSVIDFIPPATSALSFVSIPAGAINNSTTTKVDISNITVAANTTQSIIFDVTINGGTPEGTRIDNTAQITNPNGPDGDAIAQSLFVYGAPSNGAKLLYLDDLNTGTKILTRVLDVTPTTSTLGGLGGTLQLNLSPATTAPLTLGSGPIGVNLWLYRNAKGVVNPRTVDVQLGYTGGSTGIIDSDTQSITMGDVAAPQLVTFVLNLASDLTLNSNTTIYLLVTNNSPIFNNQVIVASYLNSIPSAAEVNSNTVINVDSVAISPTSNPTPGQTIAIQAVVSDPFGEADIQPTGSPTLLITDPDTQTTNPQSATDYAIEAGTPAEGDADPSTRTYTWSFDIPPLPSPPGQGDWTVSVTADEGTEGTISNTGVTTFNTASISNLSSSKKSVAVKFGGEADPGDVLVYTITLDNTGSINNATNVSVSDTIPSNTTNFTVTGIPAGAVNNSTAGTGPLSITGINVAAGTTETITFEVTISGSASPGDTVNNTAGISNPSGLGANPAAPTIIVSPSAIASSGNKALYLDNLTGSVGDLTRTPPGANSSVTVAAQNGTATVTLSPVIEADLTMSAGPIPISLWLDSNNSKNGNIRSIDVSLRKNGVSIASQTLATALTNTPAEILFLPQLLTNTSLVVGDVLDLRVTNNSPNANRPLDLNSLNGVDFSTVTVNSQDVINIDNITVNSAAGCASPITNVSSLPSTIYICATVSDPFGDYDIEPLDDAPAITITDPDGLSTYVPATLPTPNPLDQDGIRIYQWSLPVPAPGPSLGAWDIDITVDEGEESSPIQHNANGSFSTASNPNLSTSTKTVTDKFGGDAEPGDILIYNINLAETGGTSATSISLVDSIATNTSLVPGSLKLCLDAAPLPVSCSSPLAAPGDYTDNSSSSLIDISGLTVPANQFVNLEFQVSISGAAQPGDFVDNSSTITNPNGPGAVVYAPTLIVSPSLIGGSGTKNLYLDNLDSAGTCGDAGVATDCLSRVLPVGNSLANLIGGGAQLTLDLADPTEAGLTLGSGPIQVPVWIAGQNINGIRTIQTTLSYSGPSSGSIGSDTKAITLAGGSAPILIAFNINLASNLTLSAGTVFTLQITNASTNVAREIDVHTIPGGESIYSAVDLNSNTVINVDDLSLYNASGCSASPVTNVTPGTTVYICATVSDPFGDYDIEPLDDTPVITITDPDALSYPPTSPPVLQPLINGKDGDSLKVYEWSFAVPAGPTLGTWDLDVTAQEGQESLPVSHSSSTTFSTAPDPNLSTSTKSVVDKFGGDADPGDVLVYTVAINESAGSIATNISVADNVPVNTTLVPGSMRLCRDALPLPPVCMQPLSAPTDFTDNSTGGLIDITGLTVNAGGSVNLEFQVTINGGAQPGDLIDNSATVVNPNGPGAGVQAPTVIVSQSQLGGAGTKNLYLDNLNAGGTCPNSAFATACLTRTVTAGDTTVNLVGLGASIDIELESATQADLILGSGPIQIPLWMNGANKNGLRDLQATLSYSGSSNGTIGSDTSSINLTNNTANVVLLPFTINLASELTLLSGTTLTLRVTNNSANVNRHIDLHSIPAGESIVSSVNLNANTVVNVDSLQIHDVAYPGSSIVSTIEPPQNAGGGPNPHIFIRASASDPFGGFDINPGCPGVGFPADANCPSVTLAGPVDEIVNSNAALVSDPGDHTRIFEYDFTVPYLDDEAEGQWNVSVTADEGTEGSIDHSSNTTFFTKKLPNVSTSTKVVVDTNGGDVEPGDTLHYTISIIESEGGSCASGCISLSDTIDTDTSGLVITSILDPAWVNASTSTDLNVSNISILAMQTIVVEFNVTVDSVPAGSIISNSVNVLNSDGPGGVATSVDQVVQESLLSGSGTKPVYLHTLAVTPTLTRSQHATTSQTTITAASSIDIDLTPALARALTLGSGNFQAFLWLHADSVGTRAINAQLRYFGASSGVIDDFTQIVTLGNSLATATRVPFALDIASDLNLLAGTQLRLRVTNQTASGNVILSAYNSGNPNPYSQVNLNANTVIEVDSVEVYDTAHDGLTEAGGGTLLNQVTENTTVYIRAKVTDPFGSFDINPGCAPPVNCPTIDISDPDTQEINDGDMGSHVYEDVSAGFRIYEFNNPTGYLVPLGADGGFWTMTVTAVEGDELDISDSGIGSILVGLPVLTLTKVADQTLVDSGDEVIYTITLSHIGTSDATNVEVENKLSEFSQLRLDGYGSTGVPEDVIDLDVPFTILNAFFANDEPPTYGYTPNYLCGVPCIDPDVTYWKIEITQDMQPGQSFDIRYKTRVE